MNQSFVKKCITFIIISITCVVLYNKINDYNADNKTVKEKIIVKKEPTVRPAVIPEGVNEYDFYENRGALYCLEESPSSNPYNTDRYSIIIYDEMKNENGKEYIKFSFKHFGKKPGKSLLSEARNIYSTSKVVDCSQLK